jgi:ribose transport system permease protein
MLENEKTGSSGDKDAQRLNRSLLGSSWSRLWALAFLGVLFVIFSIFAQHFFTVPSVLNLLVQTSTFTILGIGAALVLIVGGIDFSLGAVVALAGTAVTVFAAMGIPIWIAMILAIGVGGLVGVANGFLVARLRLPAFITTLGMATILYGFLGWFQSFLGAAAAHLTPSAEYGKLGDLANTPLFAIFSTDASGARVEVFPGISWILIIMAVIAGVFQFILAKTRTGRWLFVVGSNPITARLSGIQAVRVRILAFTLASLLGGVAGVLLASRLGGPPGGAAGYEIIAMAIAMIGGACLAGGAGSIGGTVVGSFILITLSMGLTMMNNSNPGFPLLFNGGVILGAVYLEQLRQK